MPVLSSFVSLPGVAANVPIQLPRDFSAIGFAGENPMFVVVNPSLGITKLSDLIARAKAHPDDISCAVTGVGRLTHLTAELLQSRSGINRPLYRRPGVGDRRRGQRRRRLYYRGLLGHRWCDPIGLDQSHSGRIGKPRLAEFPGVPTVAETLPDFAATRWQVLVAPLGTSESIIKR